METSSFALPSVTGPTILTPAFATHLRTQCLYPRQRQMAVNNIARLTYIIRTGQWTPGSPIRLALLPDGREWLIDGNHSCEAVIRTGIAVPVTLILTECRTENDAHRYYASIDINKPRTAADHRRAMGDDDLPLAAYLFSAAGFIIGGLDFRCVPEVESRQARSAVANEYHDEAQLLADAIAKGVSECTRVIKRAPVMAMALTTFKHQPEKAKEFWGDAGHDRGDEFSPHRAMTRQLRGIASTQRATWRQQAIVVTMAWNAFMRGERRRHFQPSRAENLRLIGTPIDLNVLWAGRDTSLLHAGLAPEAAQPGGIL